MRSTSPLLDGVVNGDAVVTPAHRVTLTLD
jgi:hypothetical protein